MPRCRRPGTRLLPSKALRRQSKALNRSASTAQITGPSHASIVACPGIVGKLAGDLGQGDIALRRQDRFCRRFVGRPGFCVRLSSASVARRLPMNVRSWRISSDRSNRSPASRAIGASGLCSALCSQTAPMSNQTPPSAGGCSVHARPPTRADASSTTARVPASRSTAAAPKPATPAPMIATSVSVTQHSCGQRWVRWF